MKGSAGKKRLVLRLSHFFLSSVLFLGALSTPALAQVSTGDSGTQAVSTNFSDVSRTHPNYVAITYLRDSGFIKGYDDNTFRPANLINKAELTKVVIESLDVSEEVPFKDVFPDVTANLWYSPYVMTAYELGVVQGNGIDGSFEGAKNINLAEFLKILLEARSVNVGAYQAEDPLPGISDDAWFAPYVNYAAALGIVRLNAQGTVDPGKELTRADVADMVYLLDLVSHGSDTQFLLSRAEAEMAQIEVYIAANQVGLAKSASELAVDLTQQAYKNMPTETVVLGAAKIARAYDWLVDAYILGIQKQNEAAAAKANEVIDKATEAWQANPDVQPIAAHIKERARDILEQVGGEEV